MSVGLFGGSIGVPGALTAFAYTGALAAPRGIGFTPFSSFGLAFGSFSVELFTIFGTTSVITGFQTASCPS